jgi:hypothetical protein
LKVSDEAIFAKQVNEQVILKLGISGKLEIANQEKKIRDELRN